MDQALQEKLLQEQRLSSEQIQNALKHQSQEGGSFAEVLVGLGYLSGAEVQQAVASVLQKPFFDLQALLGFVISSDLMDKISYNQALLWMVLPYQKEAQGLVMLICAEPPDEEHLKRIRGLCGEAACEIGLAAHSDLQKAIRYHYGRYMLERLERENQEGIASPPSSSALASASAGAAGSASSKKRVGSLTQSQILLRQEALCPACQYPYEKGAKRCSQCGYVFEDAERQDPLAGEVVSGRWRLIRPLGEGGMGMVYQAQDIENKTLCAIKFLRSHQNNPQQVEEREIKRFEKEAQILSDLRHPNILELRAYGVSRTLGFYLVTEFLQGKSLDVYAEKHSDYIPYLRICQILCQVCDAMGFAHERGVTHRDIKPENIFLIDDGSGKERIKVIDFGIAHKQQAHEARLTSTGMMIGTPRYIAPEQIQGRPSGHLVDIYALAVILFELLTFRDLFVADNIYEYLMRHIHAEPPSLQDIRPDREYPNALEQLVRDGLAKQPERRPQSMHAFKERLLSIAAMPWARSQKQTREFLVPDSDNLGQGVGRVTQLEPPTEFDIGANSDPSQAVARFQDAVHALPSSPLVVTPSPLQQPPHSKAEERFAMAQTPSSASLQSAPWPSHLDPPTAWTDDEFLDGVPSQANLPSLSSARLVAAPSQPAMATQAPRSLAAIAPASSPLETLLPQRAATPSRVLPSLDEPPSAPVSRAAVSSPQRPVLGSLRPPRTQVPKQSALWEPKRRRFAFLRWLFLLFLLLGFTLAAFSFFVPERAEVLWKQVRGFFSSLTQEPPKKRKPPKKKTTSKKEEIPSKKRKEPKKRPQTSEEN